MYINHAICPLYCALFAPFFLHFCVSSPFLDNAHNNEKV